jgi:uncharacterized membrane protein YoaK (UPF0700 family)
MSSPLNSHHTRLKSIIALVLTFAAGVVDIVGYITLFHTFTAHMTGTTVHLGNSLATRHWNEAIIAASVVLAFVLGSVIGRLIIEVGARNRVRCVATITLGIEALLLLAFVPAAKHAMPAQGRAEPSLLIATLLAMLALAMGLQTATLTRIGPLTVHTTFVTGMLNKLAQLISHALYASWDALTCTPEVRAGHLAKRDERWAQARFLFGIWLLYLAGAAAGTALQERWGRCSLLLPTALLVIAIGADLRQPLSIEEEQEHSER